jgi:hypothetical protein
MRLTVTTLSATALFTTLFVSQPLFAENVTPVRLRYQASSGCAGERGFFEQVTARTQRVRLAKPSERATVLHVSIREVPGGLAGSIELRGDEGTTSAREVKAQSCDQVVAALAIMAALAIDPDASTEPLPKPRPAPKPPPPKPAPQPVVKPAPTEPAPSLRSHWKVGISLAALAGVFDDSVLAVRPFVELAREGRPAWGYTVRLSGARFESKFTRSEGTGEFALYSGRLEPCPAHLRAWEPVWISACLVLDAGWLEARGADVTPRQSVSRFWLAAGPTARVELRVLEILALEASGELFFPFVRDRFFVGKDATVHRTPAVGGGGAIGLGVFFP